MNKTLRGILIAVAALSIIIALYAPVTRFFENKSLDDEMDTLRAMKRQGSQQAKTADAESDSTETDHSLEIEAQRAPQTDALEADLPNVEISRAQLDAATEDGSVEASPIRPETDQSLIKIPPTVSRPEGGAAQAKGTPAPMRAFGITAQDTLPDTSIDAEMPRQTGAPQYAADAASAISSDADLSAPTPQGEVARVVVPGVETTPQPLKQNMVGIDAGGAFSAVGPSPAPRLPDMGIEGPVGVPPDATADPTSYAAAPVPTLAPEPTPAFLPDAYEPLDPVPTPAPEPTPAPTPFVFDEAKILPEYRELYGENSDFVGWLSIDGTLVDYPVMQSEDDEYYLARDFYGKKNYNGQLILDTNADPFTPSMNLVISGHNMNSGKMFGRLENYASRDYARKHSTIAFDTLFRKGEYKVVAAFYTWDHTLRADGFKYNVNISYKLELRDFLRELDEIKLYDTGVSVEFGDELLMLSTCSYQTSDGRFVVVARRLRDGEER